MARFIYIVVLAFLFGGCASPKRKAYNYLKSIPTKQAIYHSWYLKIDSTAYDTINISIKKDKYLTYHATSLDEEGPIEAFVLTDINPPINNEFWDIILTYEVLTDSIVYLDTIQYERGEVKSYKIGEKDYQVLKQPMWGFFSKSRVPDSFWFYHKDYGLLCVLSRTRKRKFIGFLGEKPDPVLTQLIKTLEEDAEFFKMKNDLPLPID